ncbi:uncharacterized protein LOC131320530 [Rhododendron vialii]|uniref:uncharacterized protein LOC131320530 n=1 Tax=Rhododendron vialii TaxID=182163 RepID=UPI00265E10C0|nr:uncharacterized protein LOC131320530 [Rhododendron vialii]
MEVSNARKDVVADSDDMVFEEGQSSESVNNICKSVGHVHDYESSNTISLKLGQMESSDDSDKELESDSDDETIITLVTLALHEHHQKYYNRIPCRTSILRGHDYVLEVFEWKHMFLLHFVRRLKYTLG